MRDGFSPVPTPEFLRLCRLVELLQEGGIPERALDAMLEEKIRADLSSYYDEGYRQPSLN